MEMKIRGKSDIEQIELIILFEAVKDKDHFLLDKLNFGSGKLKHPHNITSFKVDQAISLNELFYDEQNFFMYNGQSTFNYCQNSIEVIREYPAFMSLKQLEEFVKPKLRVPLRKRNSEILEININKKLNLFENFKTVDVQPKTPGSLLSSLFLFKPNYKY